MPCTRCSSCLCGSFCSWIRRWWWLSAVLACYRFAHLPFMYTHIYVHYSVISGLATGEILRLVIARPFRFFLISHFLSVRPYLVYTCIHWNFVEGACVSVCVCVCERVYRTSWKRCDCREQRWIESRVAVCSNICSFAAAR